MNGPRDGSTNRTPDAAGKLLLQLFVAWGFVYVLIPDLRRTADGVDDDVVAFLFLNVPLQLALLAVMALLLQSRSDASKRTAVAVGLLNMVLIAGHLVLTILSMLGELARG